MSTTTFNHNKIKHPIIKQIPYFKIFAYTRVKSACQTYVNNDFLIVHRIGDFRNIQYNTNTQLKPASHCQDLTSDKKITNTL